LFKEAVAPFADNLAGRIETGGDDVVAKALGRE
jgi:hypothetical protein